MCEVGLEGGGVFVKDCGVKDWAVFILSYVICTDESDTCCPTPPHFKLKIFTLFSFWIFLIEKLNHQSQDCRSLCRPNMHKWHFYFIFTITVLSFSFTFFIDYNLSILLSPTSYYIFFREGKKSRVL